MNWDELNAMWREQGAPAGRAIDAATLERTFAVRHAKYARRLFWRDLREAVAAVLVAGVFTSVGWHMGRDGWPMLLSVLLMLGLGGFFVAERIRSRKGRLAPDAPLLARLEAEIVEQHRQRRLLLGVSRWYLGPVLGAALVFVATVMYHAPLPPGPKLAATAVMVGLLALTAWGTIALNRFAVRRAIEPELQELERMRADLAQ